MEKINIAELLKDCPKGTKLYSPLVGECTLEHIHGELKKILISTSDGTTLTFNNNGTYFQIGNSECLLFPSKDQRDWSKFQTPFKDGDILISGLEDNPFIFKRINGLGNAQCYCAISCFGQLILNNDNWTCIKGCRLATEEEKQKLFDAIKVNGYKWNEETKTLEKLIEQELIKKACEWLSKALDSFYVPNYSRKLILDTESKQRFIEHFKKAMEKFKDK